MNKAELKKKWGKYCDTDKLVDQMVIFMSKYNIRHSVNGIGEMLDTFFTNKEGLINMMRRSENYTGDLRIMVSTQMNRYGNKNEIGRFINCFYDNVEAEKIIIRDEDESGKTLPDYIKVGQKKVTIDDIVNNKINSVNFGRWDSVFDRNGHTLDSIDKANKFFYIINSFYRYCGASVNYNLASIINGKNASLKITPGMKTSRAFNKVCHFYGIDTSAKGIDVKIASGAKFTDGTNVPDECIGHNYKVKETDGKCATLFTMKKPISNEYLSNVKYNKLFAEYSDMVADEKRSIKFFISVNPIDYLTMSIGRSWNSCHKPGGGWFGGTVSYMLDEVSIITFVHDKVPDDFITEGKIYRNMFHYKDGTLLQSRVYPQGNDGCTDLYSEFREIMQKEISSMLGSNNPWITKDDVLNINSVGNHYKDYSYLRNGINKSCIYGTSCREMTIGHINVCPNCGREENISSCLIAHRDCTAI